MPVQINEVIIRTIVDPKHPVAADQADDTKSKSSDDLDAIEQVLEIIKEKQLR